VRPSCRSSVRSDALPGVVGPQLGLLLCLSLSLRPLRRRARESFAFGRFFRAWELSYCSRSETVLPLQGLAVALTSLAQNLRAIGEGLPLWEALRVSDREGAMRRRGSKVADRRFRQGTAMTTKLVRRVLVRGCIRP